MKLHKILFSIAILVTTIVPSLFSQTQGLGVGISLGNPTGLSVKAWLSRTSAVQVGVGWNHYNDSYVTAEYLMHSLHAIKSKERFPLYYGPGVTLGGSNTLGIRFLGGIAWCSRATPIDVFLHVAPVLYLNPSTEFDVEAALGIRYFF
jgi:hypothetical protein